MSTELKQTSEFYDLRGNRALVSKSKKFGSRRIPVFLNTPYVKAEEIIEKQLRDADPYFLDLCCGTGIHSIWPALLGYKVIGTDISEKSIEAAINLAKANEVFSKCSFLVNKAEDSLQAQNVFDVILISGSTYYLERESIIPQIVNSLKANGTFIAIETNGSNVILNFYRIIKNLFVKNRDKQTTSSLIRLSELALWQKYFKAHEVFYYDFFTLLTPLWQRLGVGNAWLKIAKKLDYWFFKIPGTKYLSFKFVFVGKKESNVE